MKMCGISEIRLTHGIRARRSTGILPVGPTGVSPVAAGDFTTGKMPVVPTGETPVLREQTR